jgi:hypothetical protein
MEKVRRVESMQMEQASSGLYLAASVADVDDNPKESSA